MGCGASSGQPNSPASEAAPAALDQGIGEPVVNAPDAPEPAHHLRQPARSPAGGPQGCGEQPVFKPEPAVAEPIPWPTHPEWLKDLPTERVELIQEGAKNNSSFGFKGSHWLGAEKKRYWNELRATQVPDTAERAASLDQFYQLGELIQVVLGLRPLMDSYAKMRRSRRAHNNACWHQARLMCQSNPS